MSDKGFMKTLATYDRRWIYFVLFLVVIIPLLRPIGMPISVSPDTVQYYEAINSVGDGDKVLFTLNTEFSGYNEIQSGIIASMRVFIENNCKICIAVAHPEATGIPELIFQKLEPELEANGYKYGEDYVILGYVMPNEAAVAAMAQDFQGTITQDWLGRSIDDTFLIEINTWEDWDLIADFTTGIQTTALLNHFALRGTPMTVNCIGVMIASQKPYVDTGVYLAILQSMRGGAELEFLTEHPGPGLTAMDGFTFGHYMLLIFILAGNIGYYGYTRKNVGGDR
jgi:hypothetical protein